MKWTKPENRAFVETILALDTPAEARRFLRDLMTEQEITEFSKRLQAARMLFEKNSYSTIEEKTGLSSTTVARVSKWLGGKRTAYRKIFNRITTKSTKAS